jgi:signal transduction histidine kinase
MRDEALYMDDEEHIKILYIEDDPADAELVREMLNGVRGVRFDIRQATRLSAAIQSLKHEPFDIVLSDLDLPDSKGTDTFLKVHAEFSDMPVVLLTGLNDEELAIKAVRDGAQDYLVKGRIDSNLLVRSIRYSMERQKLLTRLDKSLREIKTLKGLIPMCAWCRKIRDDEGYWKNVEAYIEEHTHAAFSHGICPECMKKDHPDLYKQVIRDHPELLEKEKVAEEDHDRQKSMVLRVLLIEDDAVDADYLRELLSEIKSVEPELMLAGKLSAGLERLARENIDIVLLDLGLPDSIGIETFIRVHTPYPDIPIVVLTGLHDEELAISALRSGAQDYLVKGQTDSSLLLKSLLYAIERNRLFAELENNLREIRKLERERNNILSMFAHDIMNAIAPSIGFLTRILSGRAQNPNADLELIRDSLTDAEHLLANFIEFSKFEAQKYIPKPGPLEIDVVISRQIESARMKADEKNITIASEISAKPLPQVAADEAMINRVVANLLDNAIKYTKPEGMVNVKVFNRDRDILVQVLDTGIGIPDDHITFIFDAFYRSTSDQRGSGLGLSIARTIIEAHGGNIWAESVPGKGSSFSFTLPKRRS